MVSEPDNSPTARVEPPGAAPFRLAWLLFWMPGSLVLGLAMAWVAVVAGDYFAPLVLFPILVGLMTGAVSVALVRLCQIGHRGTIFAGVVLTAVTVAGAQHYVTYLRTYRPGAKSAKMFPLGSELLPSFGEYLRNRAALGRQIYGRRMGGAPLAWTSWTVDGLLILAASLALTTLAARQPYCSRCRSWHHTTRSGSLEPPLARQLADLASLALPADADRVRYRLGNCQSGCGPTSLSLYWEQLGGKPQSQRVWLSSPLRNQVIELLDRRVEEGGRVKDGG
jgi:hypothetical protein